MQRTLNQQRAEGPGEGTDVGLPYLEKTLRKKGASSTAFAYLPHIQPMGKAGEICQLQGSFLDKLPKGRGSWAWCSCAGLLGKEDVLGQWIKIQYSRNTEAPQETIVADIMWLDALCIGDGLGRHLWSNLVLFLKKLPLPALKKLSVALSVRFCGYIHLTGHICNLAPA